MCVRVCVFVCVCVCVCVCVSRRSRWQNLRLPYYNMLLSDDADALKTLLVRTILG